MTNCRATANTLNEFAGQTNLRSDTLLLMELKEQAPAGTLNHKLGDTAHVSGLAIRLARMTGAEARLPEWLLKTAVERGAKHYQRSFDPSLPPDNPRISDEEIGVVPWLVQRGVSS